MGYTAPRLHDGREWYIDFYIIDPLTGEPRRKKYMVPKDRLKRRRYQTAQEMLTRIGARLREGWNPWISETGARGNTSFQEIRNQYLAHIRATLRKSSIYNYDSRLKVLDEYQEATGNRVAYAFQYDSRFVNGFLDWLISVRGVTSKTRNNYRGFCSALGDWMAERGYVESNPAEKTKKMMEQKKQRQPMTADMLGQLTSYLKDRSPEFLLACMMEYYTFIRPHELLHVRISDISLKDMTVFVPAYVSKSKRDCKVSINETILKMMLDMDVFSHPGDHYLFGRDFRPSAKKGPDDLFNKEWAKVRKALKWSYDIKFYSLKDSGIRDLSNDAGVVIARDQARHTDITTTNKYLQGRDLEAPEAAKHFKGFLG